MENLIKLENLTTGYDHKPITRDINAVLRTGELTCLLGPNGAGKSTLLKTLCAFQPPLSGMILIDGKNLKLYNARELARVIGVVLTERPVAMNMTVEELVGIGRSPYTSFLGGMNKADREIVAESMQQVGITDLKDRAVHTLSDGERQKAFIAKALAQQTQIILLDEPTAFLDFPSKVEIMKLLLNIARSENKIVFLSTHDIELALQISDTLWLLDKDKGLTIGTPAQLAENGSFGAYFERPGLNFNPLTFTFIIEK